MLHSKKSDGMKKFTLPFLLPLLLCPALPARGMDFIQAWELALAQDPQYQGARFSAQSKQENIAIAKGRLLPTVNFIDFSSLNNQESTNLSLNTTIKQNYTAHRATLSIEQPIFRMDRYYGLKGAESEAAAATQFLANELQATVTRVATAYFDTLLAREKHENIQNRTKFFRSSLALAQKGFQHGQATRTDIEDAKSRLDTALADEIEAKNRILFAEQSLAAVIGSLVPASDLQPIDAGRLPIDTITVPSLPEWISMAKTNNPEILAVSHNLDAASQEIKRRRAGHYPTLDLVARKSFARSDVEYTVGNQYYTDLIGVQLAVPLFAGGGTEASVRQSVADHEKTRYQLEATIRKNDVEISRLYAIVTQGVSRIKALEQALISSREAIKGNQKGVQAGTRNIVDVLNAEQQFFITQSNLTEARHVYVVSLLKLKAAAGMIGEADIREVNSWLSRS